MHARTRSGPRAPGDPYAAVALPLLDVVHDVALVLTDDPAAAAWLTEATFAAGRRTFAAVDPGVSGRAWLLRVTYGLWRRHLHDGDQWLLDVVGDGAQGGPRPPAELEPVVELGPAAPQAEIETRIESQIESQIAVSWHTLRLLEEGDRLRRALVRLPESYRLAVALVDVHGFTCAEAATVTSTPRAVVLSRVHRARACLRVVAAPERQAVGTDAL